MKKKTIIAICDGHAVYRQEDATRNSRNYLYINGKRIWLHTYLVETYQRKLRPREIVHHKDFNHLNDSEFNLQILTRAQHVRIHKPVLGYKFTSEQRQRLSDSHKGQVAWNKGHRGFKHTAEAKRNMSNAQKGRKITWGDKISKAKTKVTKQQLLEYISKYPTASLKQVMTHFGLKTHGPISKHGGMRKLRKEKVV